MSASPFQIYAAAKRALMSGSIDIDGDSFRVSLFTSASNAATLSLSAISQVTGEVTGAGYTQGGLSLVGMTWTQGASARQFKFAASPPLWSGPLNAVKYAVVAKTDGRLLAVSQLSASQFNVPGGTPFGIGQGSPLQIFALS